MAFEKTIAPDLGEILEQARKAQGLSRQALSEKMKGRISNISIAKYEKAGQSDGQYPPLPKLAQLVLFLKIDPYMVFASCLEPSEEVEDFVSEENRINDTNGFKEALDKSVRDFVMQPKFTELLVEKMVESMTPKQVEQYLGQLIAENLGKLIAKNKEPEDTDGNLASSGSTPPQSKTEGIDHDD